MKASVAIAAAVTCLGAMSAGAQSLPPITQKMVSYSVVANDTAVQVINPGLLGITSVSYANSGSAPALILVLKKNFSSAGCTGTLVNQGRYFYAEVPAFQSVQFTYPTPFAFFNDQGGYVCLQVYDSNHTNSVSVTIVGYVQ